MNTDILLFNWLFYCRLGFWTADEHRWTQMNTDILLFIWTAD